MDSGRARVLQQSDPRKCRVTYKGKANRWSPVWENNPRIAAQGEAGDFQELVARDMNNMRAYHVAKTDERWFYNPAFRPDVGEIYFSDLERAFGARRAGLIVIEPHIKPGASPNKSWGWARWQALARLMCRAGMRPVQLGPPGTPRLDGVELLETPNFRFAATVLAGARAAILPEGGLHHAAAALGVPSVVIFGGYISPALTGYDMHRNLFTGGEPCGMRRPCAHCAAAMTAITPEQVFNELSEVLK
ncbi:MAG TPA: glycosyltransferase family 9 protein [Usitatibacter sp.]|nr:glycosyltransferase family 9 protein [Usitatibacter sp.]